MQENKKESMLLNEGTIKATVKSRYGAIAEARKEKASCCSTSCCGDELETSFAPKEYETIEGHEKDADLNLGCGIPTKVAAIKPGDTVIDLGAGAGNDAFIARRLVGEAGRVIGVDMTPQMVERAKANAAKLGYSNVEFHLGEIEKTPLPSDTADVAISNCVFNLLPDKTRGFREVHRVLKRGGHFSISDIVTTSPLPEKLLPAAALYTGCVAGALTKDEYLKIIREAGFTRIATPRERVIELPIDELAKQLSPEEREAFEAWDGKILSVTFYGEKP